MIKVDLVCVIYYSMDSIHDKDCMIMFFFFLSLHLSSYITLMNFERCDAEDSNKMVLRGFFTCISFVINLETHKSWKTLVGPEIFHETSRAGCLIFTL